MSNDLPEILLSGATGYLGTALLTALMGEGFPVAVMVRRNAKGRSGSRIASFRKLPGLRVLEGDLELPLFGLDPGQIRPAQIMIHAAAEPKFEGVPADRLWRVHVRAMVELAELVRASGIARVLHFSTAFVTPDGSGFLREGAPGNRASRNVYEQTKTDGERLLTGLIRDRVEIIRPGIIVPPADAPKEVLNASPIGQFIRSAVTFGGRCPTLPADPAVHPGFVHMEDVVRFTIDRVKSPREGKRVWNLVAAGLDFGELAACACQAGLFDDVHYAADSSANPLKAWLPYIGEKRSWGTEKARAFLGAHGGRLSEVDGGYFRRLWARDRDSEWQRRVA